MAELPIGSIICFSSEVCPEGYMPCDGRELPKNAYKELYFLIGGRWGETPTTFCLPDIRGQFVRGWDKEGNVDSERIFGSLQEDAFQGHGHGVSILGKTSESSLHYEIKSIQYGTNTFSSNDEISFNSVLNPEEYQHKINAQKTALSIFGSAIKKLQKWLTPHIKHSHELPEIKVKDAINSTYQEVRVSVETRPKNIALIYCIKVK